MTDGKLLDDEDSTDFNKVSPTPPELAMVLQQAPLDKGNYYKKAAFIKFSDFL